MSPILDIKTPVRYIVVMESLNNPTRRAARRYAVQFSVTMALYIVVLVSALEVIQRYTIVGSWRLVLLLLPLIPVIAIVPTVLRWYRDTDEFERRLTTESLAIAAGVTAVYAVTCGFLEIAGMARVSAWYTWLVVMGSWFLARLILRLRYR
jgi:hypothetical protein